VGSVVRRFNIVSFAALCAVLSTTGCAGEARARVSAVYAHDSRRLLRLDYDNDGDGRIDVRTYMRDARPVRLESDRNRDGRIDRWEYYSRSGALLRIGASTQRDGREDMWIRTDGTRRIVEVSSHRDGRIDRREIYERDALVETEVDTNHDGLSDRWERYRGGAVVQLMLDEERRHGRPTRRIVYGPGGSARVETIGPEVPDASSR
jgi:hypothetical protein